MSALAATADAVPARLDGWAWLANELRPTPGRFGDSLRLVALVLVTVAVGETFRMPEIAVSAYVVLFVSRSERSSTVKTAAIAGLAVIFGAFATAVVFMASLSQPALRVPLIAVVTFAAMFFSRVSPLGPAGFAAGFIMAYGLTLGDQVLGLALQSPQVSNTTDAGLPQLLFIPPEEALLHFVLWLVPIVALPVGLVIVANLLTGRQPRRLLRAELADQLENCANFCAGKPGAAQALTASARRGFTGLDKLLDLAGPSDQPPDDPAMIRETGQLALALLAWPLVAPGESGRSALRPCAEGLMAAAHKVRGEATSVLAPVPAPSAPNEAAVPLAAEIERASAAVLHAFGTAAAVAPRAAKAGGHLIAMKAVRDPESTRFAFKVTLAVMLSYGAENLLDWPAIHTCVVTCFFVSLGTIGESLHKARLRVVGAMIGGALGIGTILVLMPIMTNLGQFLLALGAVTLLAAWVACGSERISYAGWQIGLAYYLTVLQGYGPTLDMQTARDRVIGIILGNIVVLLIFSSFWPVSVARAARLQVWCALRQMAALMRLEQRSADEAAAAAPGLRRGFVAAATRARDLLANTDYERVVVELGGVDRPIDPVALTGLDTVMLILCIILGLRSDPGWPGLPPSARQAAHAYHDGMAHWFERCAAWVLNGADGAALERDIPAPPQLGDNPAFRVRAAWYRVLDAELRAVMARVMRQGAGPAQAHD